MKLRKTIAMLLAVVMALGLMWPMGVLADNTSDAQIMREDGSVVYFKAGDATNGVSGETTATAVNASAGGKVEVSKTIAGTAEADKFEITLQVKTQQMLTTQVSNPEAAVALVLDVSNSMKYCSQCGSSGRCDCANRTSRIYEAKLAAEAFVNQLKTDAAGGVRYVSVIKFGTAASVVCDWYDISTTAGYAAVVSAIRNVSISSNESDGGTNLDAGLGVALTQLNKDTVKNVANRFTVALTDGEPTYYVKPDGTRGGTGGASSKTLCDDTALAAAALTAIGKLYTICYGAGSDVCYTIEGESVEHACTKTGWHQHTYTEIQENGYGKSTTGKLVGGVFQEHKGKDHFHRDGCTSGWYNGSHTGTTKGENIKTTVEDFLRAISSNYYDAANAAQVNTSFGNISALIKLLTEAWTVTDPMGSLIKFGAITTSQGSTVAACSDGTLAWNLLADTPVSHSETVGGVTTTTYTYTLKYTVTLNTADKNFVEGKEYATNGYTSLSYVFYNGDGKITDESGAVLPDQSAATANTIGFNVPGVHGETPEVSYTIEYYKQNRDGGYDKVTADTETVNNVKLWTIASAPEGFEDMYENYTYDHANPATSMLLSADNMVMKLYYNLTPTNVLVTHWYVTHTTTLNGVVDSVASVPVSPEGPFYEGDSFTADLLPNGFTQVASVTVDGTAYATDDYTDVTLGASGTNSIDIYYEKSVDARANVPYTVNHYYTTKEYQIVDGRYQLVTTQNQQAGTPVSGTGKAGTSYTATAVPNGYTETSVTSATNTKTITLTEGGNNVINIYYEKLIDARGEPVTVTVDHKYTIRTTTISGTSDDTVTEADTTITGTWYAGERFTATPIPKDFTRTSADAALTITLTAGTNHIDIDYLKEVDNRVSASVTVNHVYRTWTMTVDAETGDADYTLTNTSDPTVVTPTGWYVGQTFVPTQIANGYTLNAGLSDEEGAELVAGSNVFNLIYDTYVNELGEADVTVIHHYETYTTYVNAAGQLVENEKTETMTRDDTVTGLVGEFFTATVKETDGFVKYDADTADLKVTLVGEDGEYNIYYKKMVNTLVGTDVTVKHTYVTYTTHVVDGAIVTEETARTTEEPYWTSDAYFEGQSFTATKAEKNGFTFSSTLTTDDYTNVLLGAAGTNVMELLYSKTVIDLPEADVVVRHHYTTTTKEVVDGVYRETPSTSDTILDAVKKTIGLSFTATAQPGDFTQTTEAAALTITVVEGTNYIDIYYTKTNDLTQAATVVVTHNYITYDWDDSEYSSFSATEEEVSALAGTSFTATRKTMEDTYAFVSAAPAETINLVAGANTVTMNYSRKIDTRVATTVTVNHKYDTYDLYTGQTTENTAEPEQVTFTGVAQGAWIGNSFTAAEIAKEGYVRQTEDADLTIVLAQSGNVIDIVYLRTVDSTPPPVVPPVTPSYNYYRVTVNYLNEVTGTALADAYTTANIREGLSYNVGEQTAVQFEGFTQTRIEGQTSGLIYGNVTVNVYYAPAETSIPDEELPTGEQPETDPAPTQPDEIEIDEGDIPLGDAPATGDATRLLPVLLVMFASLTGIVVLSLGRKKKTEK